MTKTPFPWGRAQGLHRWLAAMTRIGLAIVVAACLVTACEQTAPVRQPLAFNHKRHLDAKMDCIQCHEQVEDGPIATLPLISKCMECHNEPQGKSPEEPKVRELAKTGEIAWVQVNRVPGHVYFTHQAHVTGGKIKCETCHGDMRTVSTPVVVPNVKIEMKTCIGCHEKRGVSNDCTVCHK